MNLSVLIITKNESDVIEDCIKSIREIADEIIVIDADSSDDTEKVAKNLGAVVHTHKFKDFADQRNYAASLAKGKWLLYLDADEEATEAFKADILKIIEEGIKNGYFIKRKTYFYGKDWGMEDKVQRLFKKDSLKGWSGVVHETPEIDGEFGLISNPIIHSTHRDITKMVEKTNEWSEYEAKLRLKAHHPKMTPARFVRVMITAFYQSFVKEKGYSNGTAGFVEAMYQSFSMFITYAKLWEMQRSDK